MKKINETYQHEETGIHFNVEWNYNVDLDCQKKVKIIPSKNNYKLEKGFIFDRSKTITIINIGRALLEIGEFVEKL